MDLKKVRRRCEARLATLDVPTPFDLDQFVGSIAEQRGRPLQLHPARVNGAPCGVWMSCDDVDHVFDQSTTSPVHRQHIALHELGHVVAEHQGTNRSTEWVSRLLPSLDPDVVSRVLCRSTFEDADEIEAEVFASVVLERSSPRTGEPSPVSPGDEVQRRIRSALAGSLER